MKLARLLSVMCLFGAACGSASEPSLVEEGAGATVEAALESTATVEPTSVISWQEVVTRLTTAVPVIATGTVEQLAGVEERVDWLPRPLVMTHATIRIDAVWKGDVPSRVTVEAQGGCYGNICMNASHQPTFERGERALVFLAPLGNGRFAIARGEEGKINLDGRYLRPETGEVEVTEVELRTVVEQVLRKEVVR